MPKLFIFWILSLTSAISLAQTTYICQIHGKAAYTTVKQDASCQPSQMNGLATGNVAIFAPPVTVASQVALPNDTSTTNQLDLDAQDPIAKIWYDHEYGSYDRTPILPPPAPITRVLVNKPSPAISISSISPNIVKTVSKPKIVSPTVSRPIAMIYHAPSTPVLSRRDILVQEIEREQTALKVAQTQLAAAKKRQDTANIAKLNLIVSDRLANVQSLQRELQR